MAARLPKDWKDRIELAYENECDKIIYYLMFKKTKIPKGFNREIGDLAVETNGLHIVEGPNIVKCMQRRGLGTMLYERAIRDLGFISVEWSDVTVPGKHAWRSLTTRWPFSLDLSDGVITVYRKRQRRSRRKCDVFVFPHTA